MISRRLLLRSLASISALSASAYLVQHPPTAAVHSPLRSTFLFRAEKKKILEKPVFAFCKTPDATAVQRADELFDLGQEHVPALINVLRNAIALHPDNAELLWRLSRAARLMSLDERVTSTEQRKALAEECLSAAQRAVAADNENWAAHKWVAVGLKVIGDHTSTKEKLKNSYIIRDEFETALRLNPSDATTTCLLGQWHLFFAEMAWYERQIASVLFASPPTSSYENALQMFLKAENLQPGFYKRNAQLLALTYYRLGDMEQAKSWKAKTLAMPTKTLDDQLAVDELKKISV